MKKKILFLLIPVLILVMVVVLSTIKWQQNDNNSFRNPGDYLNGGGTGEVATTVDFTSSNAVIETIAEQSDLTELAGDTVCESYTNNFVGTYDETVVISDSGSYYFQGEFQQGIVIDGKNLNIHLFFDGVTITNTSGVAIDGTAGKNTVTITLMENTTNTVTNAGEDVNAIHIKGDLYLNGTGILNVTSQSKSAIKVSKDSKIVNVTLNLSAVNHGITAQSVVANNATINVLAAGKDGINAECSTATEFTTSEGYVSLVDVNYLCSVEGDGIQADTVVLINGGNCNITTTGTFVVKSSENMVTYDMTDDDFCYKYSNGTYQKVAEDQTSGTLYGLTQSCKGIKVGQATEDTPEGNCLIAICDAEIVINSSDDAIHTNAGSVLIQNGSYSIATYDDAITADGLVKITGGIINISHCYEGIEGAYIEISGGTITLTASDDGVNAASDDTSVKEHIIISGGILTINAAGDGVDSNGSILISGGTLTVYGPTTGGDAGMDADSGIVITGGKVFVSSSLGMVETPSTNSTQYVVSYAHQSTIPSGSVISLRDQDGNVLVSVTTEKNCQSVIISSPDLQAGKTYYIYGGDTQMTSFTVSSILTQVGSSGNNFPGGFGPGNGGPGNTGPGGRRF